MKRKFVDTVAKYTRSKRPKLLPGLVFEPKRRYYISATKTKNYMINDHLSDWLKMYYRDNSVGLKQTGGLQYNESKQDDFASFIRTRGIEFEESIVDYIHRTKVPVISVSDCITDETVRRTKELMHQGVPVIHSAPVKNSKQRTQGIIDLLVRSDYLDQIVNESPLTEKEAKTPASKLGQDYHYVVVDVKFSTLPLRADGKHLLNSANYPAYKAQTWIYTQAIGHIQGFTPRYAFILGRRYRYTSKGIVNQSLYSLDKLGTIDYQGIDFEYVERTKKAIAWWRQVKQHGEKWSIDPPSRTELYPNMCVESYELNPVKKQIANDIGEITNIWYCGVKQRKNAFSHGIETWKDPRCTSQTLGMGGVRGPVIDAILDINRQNVDKIRPAKIPNKYEWRVEGNEMFIDFETLIDVFSPLENTPLQEKTEMIFMIGAWYKEGQQWKYRSFIANSTHPNEEFRVMNEFAEFVASNGYPRLWNWHAESSIWKRAENRQYDRAISNNDYNMQTVIQNSWEVGSYWVDMAKLFRETPIVIKDCFNFSLKNIVNAMNKHGLVPTKMESNCQSGMDAAINAWKTYQNGENSSSPVLKDIEKYNTFDVESLYDILTYLRKNH